MPRWWQSDQGETITLLCVCHDPRHCHRGLLAELTLGKLDGDTL